MAIQPRNNTYEAISMFQKWFKDEEEEIDFSEEEEEEEIAEEDTSDKCAASGFIDEDYSEFADFDEEEGDPEVSEDPKAIYYGDEF